MVLVGANLVFDQQKGDHKDRPYSYTRRFEI
jgi:hypothetical protein